jgi:hypothetical protein
VAAAVGVREDVVPLACAGTAGGLAVSLAGDFLEWAGRLLAAEPQVGLFRVREMYLKRKDLDEGIRRAFTWPNAKIQLHDNHEAAIEYHTWWFHASIASEDRWETCLSSSLNAANGVEVEIPDPLGLWELESHPGPTPAAVASFPRALAVARRRLLAAATGFFQRMDARLLRDRKRLREYYQALLRETEKKKPRGQHAPDPEKVEAGKRAVSLELRRKLAELDERYAMQASLLPVVLVRTEVPALAVELTVFRKQARRLHTVYWNPLCKHFDPLACSRCGAGTYSPVFTNDEVAPLCPACHG